MERTIRVKGKGKIAIKPDRVCLTFSMTDTKQTYEQIMEETSKMTKILKDIFEKLGFKRDELKTTALNVTTKYESYQDIKHTWKKKFVGYEARHGLKIEFDLDNMLLGKILYELTHCKVNPEIQIHYTVKDTEAAKKKLLECAIKDSMTKAEVLASASNVTLGEIINIDYSWEEIKLSKRSTTLDNANIRAASVPVQRSYEIDLDAEDITAEDTVTVVWGIS